MPRYWLSLDPCHAHLSKSPCPVGIHCSPHPSNLHERQVCVHLPLTEADLVGMSLYLLTYYPHTLRILILCHTYQVRPSVHHHQPMLAQWILSF